MVATGSLGWTVLHFRSSSSTNTTNFCSHIVIQRFSWYLLIPGILNRFQCHHPLLNQSLEAPTGVATLLLHQNAKILKRELNERASRYTHCELKNITIDENDFPLPAWSRIEAIAVCFHHLMELIE